jgi:hypothetical protein
MIDGIQVETPQITPKQRFDSLLNQIANHMFVTDATREKRRTITVTMEQNLVPKLKNKGAKEVVFFPAGSVAVGLAVDDSDCDGVVVYSSDADLHILDPDVRMNMTADSNDVFVSRAEDDMSVEGIHKEVDWALKDDEPGALEWLDTYFFPSLNEFSNSQEKTIVDSWRKKILQTIVTDYPDQAEKIWDMMRGYLESSLLNYEFHENEPKRLSRVGDAIQEKISRRFPLSEDKQKRDRAESFIASLRKNVHFPPLQEMLTAFDIT